MKTFNGTTEILATPRVEEYPQKHSDALTSFDAGTLSVISFLRPMFSFRRPWGNNSQIVKSVQSSIQNLPKDITSCRALVPPLRRRLGVSARPKDQDVSTLLALLTRFSEFTIGQSPYEVQLAAVGSLLRGEVAEMRTGEGKSLTAALTAAALALCGKKVHVLTVNDYLSERDAKRYEPLFVELGLTSGFISETATIAERQKIHDCDIVFSAAKNVVFDYLRDQTGAGSEALGGLAFKIDRSFSNYQDSAGPILQGLDAVIVDEADSVFIDQAATPFILSGDKASFGGLTTDVLAEALALSAKLDTNLHFRIFERLKRATLTDEGKFMLGHIEKSNSMLEVAPIREHLVCQALVARHLLKNGEDYLVFDDKICIVDESTGRIMPDRQWSDGLHQLVELKEGLDASEMRTTIGRITFQRFFPRYRHVCGMSGTAVPASRELWESYGLTVRRILPRRPDRRTWSDIRIFRTADEKWSAVAHYVSACHHGGIPVLIGTRTVEASKSCGEALEELGIPHRILNAEHVAEEAAIIAQAGMPGNVTVATNMAGRGTDIELSPEARDMGGLHVVLTELHDNRRIDLQLAGRCGRQGDPGVVARFLSLEDGLLVSLSTFSTISLRWLHRLGCIRAVYLLYRLVQFRQTRRAETARRRLQKYERQREQSLALTGRLE